MGSFLACGGLSSCCGWGSGSWKIADELDLFFFTLFLCIINK